MRTFLISLNVAFIAVAATLLLNREPARAGPVMSVSSIPGLRVSDIPIERAFSTVLQSTGGTLAPAQSQYFLSHFGSAVSIRTQDVVLDPGAALVITSIGGGGQFVVRLNGSDVAVTTIDGGATGMVSVFQPVLVRPGDHLRIEWNGVGTLQGFVLNANEILP